MRIERLVTDPDGMANNVWLLGGSEEVIVVDASHEPDRIMEAVEGRHVAAILITHGHVDHVNGAPALRAATGAPVLLHPADLPLWHATHRDAEPDGVLEHGQKLTIDSETVTVLHTPGHTPGSCSFLLAERGAVLTGDTLFPGGPGATRWDYSSFPTILESIATQLFTLPAEMGVHPGHGASTSIGREAPHLEEWHSRGW